MSDTTSRMSKERFCTMTPLRRTSSGSRGRARCTRLFTSKIDWSTLVPGSKVAVMVGAGCEGGGEGGGAGGGRSRVEVREPVDAGELLLDRRGHRLRQRLGARPRISRGDEHRGRRDLRVLRDREELRRHDAGEHDDDGDNAGEHRPMDEKLGHQLAFLAATGALGRRRTRLSTITESPGFRPSSTTQSLPSQLPALMVRCTALPSAVTVQTKRPPSFCMTAVCGTTMACCVPATTFTRTN